MAHISMHKKASKDAISLKIKRFSLIYILATLILSGCETTRQIITEENVQSAPQPLDDNSIFAEIDLSVALVLEIGAEWQVRDQLTDNRAVNLSELLIIAKQQYLDGNTQQAMRLIEKISEIAALAIQQAIDNENAGPIYPNAN